MKIETVTGNVVDTDKLTDQQAEIYEAVNNLYKVCDRYNIAMIARVVADEKGQVFGANRMFNGEPEVRWKYISALIGELDNYLRNSTGGVIGVQANTPEQEG